jgi:hypothetical protein
LVREPKAEGATIMPATDKIHDAVKAALIKDGWSITADPFTIAYEEINVFADLAADRLLAAERGVVRIAVEIKSFIGRSRIHDLELTLGQYNLYQALLEKVAPERKLFLAVSDTVYTEFLEQAGVQMILQRFHVSLIVVKLEAEEIIAWIL